jgi:hypothetical protein
VASRRCQAAGPDARRDPVHTPVVHRLVACALLLVACGSEAAPRPSEAERRDLATLAARFDGDPTFEALARVEDIADDRPVAAADLLREQALPAARAQLEAVRAFEARSRPGRRAQLRLVDAYRDRIVALEAYLDVLDGAARDEPALIAALRAQREATQHLRRVRHGFEE